MAQQPQPEVVERHVAQVRARIGEAHLDARLTGQLLEHLGAVVGDRGAPPQRGAVLDDQVEECVDGVQPAAVNTDLPERLSDHRWIGAFDDLGVEEVAVPHPQPVLAVVVLAEPPPVVLVAHQLVALGHLFFQMHSGRAGAELLEDHQIDAVGVDLERHRQVLPAEVAA